MDYNTYSYAVLMKVILNLQFKVRIKLLYFRFMVHTFDLKVWAAKILTSTLADEFL